MFCFVHIEKAAGTTFHTILLNNFASYAILTPWNYWTNDEVNVFLPDEVKSLRKILNFSEGFGGHTVRSYLHYENILGQPINYITFLREPVARYVSHYNYQKNIMNIDLTFEDYLGESKFSNFMTKRIGGCYDLDQAKENLLKQFSFVGLIERFDESLLLLNQIIFNDSLIILYKKENVAKENEQDFLQKTFLEQITVNNSLDIELYTFAETFLYQKFVAQYKGNLQEALDLFSNLRKTGNVRNSIFRRILSRLYDEVFRKVERRVHCQYHDTLNDYR